MRYLLLILLLCGCARFDKQDHLTVMEFYEANKDKDFTKFRNVMISARHGSRPASGLIVHSLRNDSLSESYYLWDHNDTIAFKITSTEPISDVYILDHSVLVNDNLPLIEIFQWSVEMGIESLFYKQEEESIHIIFGDHSFVRYFFHTISPEQLANEYYGYVPIDSNWYYYDRNVEPKYID